jgi:hypothetical protein
MPIKFIDTFYDKKALCTSFVQGTKWGGQAKDSYSVFKYIINITSIFIYIDE